MEEQLTELLKKVNEVSPLVWDAAMRQVQVDLIYYSVVSVILLGLVIGGGISVRHILAIWEEPQMDPKDALALILVFFAAVAVPILISYSSKILTFALNPEWAAIDLILNKIPRW